MQPSTPGVVRAPDPALREAWPFADAPQTLPALLDATCRRFGARPATHFLGRALSWGEIGALVDKAAAGLQAIGIRRGDRIGLLLPNTPTFLVHYYAALATGATIVNFNPLYAPAELEAQARDAELAVMVTLDLTATFPKAEALLASDAVPRLIVAEFASLLPSMKGAMFALVKRDQRVDWRASPHAARIIEEAALLRHGERPTPIALGPQDLAVLQYTGGTTGTPKGAMLTHGNLAVNVAQMIDYYPGLLDGREKMMAVLPFFHVFGMTVVLNLAVGKGAQILMLPRFDLAETVKLIAAERATIMAGVPTLFNAVARNRQANMLDLTSLRFCFSGGAALPAEVKRAFEATTGSTLVEGYGLSETAPVVACNRVMENPRENSIGLPLAHTRISLRALDDPTREVPDGEKGEICIAGPQVMTGYWRQPEETAAAFAGEYFRTGDVAIRAPDGYLSIVDRIKDIIICAGYNIYPRRIEDVLHGHPAVEEAAVIGLPDRLRGEVPHAYVRLREGEMATPAELAAHLRPALAQMEWPETITISDALPKTLIGKLSKRALREAALAAAQAG